MNCVKNILGKESVKFLGLTHNNNPGGPTPYKELYKRLENKYNAFDSEDFLVLVIFWWFYLDIEIPKSEKQEYRTPTREHHSQ